jgi:Flp pilus assembly protein TadG
LFRPWFHRVDARFGVSLRRSNSLCEVFFLPVNLSESVGNLLRKIQMFMERRGEGLVEFSLVLPMFLLLMFALIDLGRWYWIRETLENAVRQAGRYAVTGQSSNGYTRVQSIEMVAQNAAAGLENLTITVSSSPDALTSWTANSAGGPGDFVKVEIQAPLGFFTPGIARYFGPSGSNTIDDAVAFRNENFPASEANN